MNTAEKTDALPYPALRDLTLDEGFIEGLRRLCQRLGQWIDWRLFGSIPMESTVCGSLHTAADSLDIVLYPENYRFLVESPHQASLLQRFERKHGPERLAVFRLLCLGEELAFSEIESLVDEPGWLEPFIDQGILWRRDDLVLLPVMCVPLGDRCYLADSLHLVRRRDQYGIQPAHVGEMSYAQAEMIRRWYGPRRFASVLEMGCGNGLVTMELREIADWREGADIYDRNVMFAQANQLLQQDDKIRFYESDLFEAVEGKFDLIVFNPYQPTEDRMDLLQRFLETAPEYLNPHGSIMLVVQMRYRENQTNVVEGALRPWLRDIGMSAAHQVWSSYFDHRRSGDAVVSTQSILFIEPQRRNGESPIRTVRDRGWIGLQARRALLASGLKS